MISRKVSVSIICILIVGFLLGVCSFDGARAQTKPTWIGSQLSATSGTGADPMAHTVVDSAGNYIKLSFLQAREVADVEFSVWGRGQSGNWRKLLPMEGFAAADTVVKASLGSPAFHFNSIRAELIYVSSGSADFWGE